mmetsp:Transcript_46457/g.110420  ORF Transcript_46457/g.110420 Transcript_46457/m.110420 type:complete len:206 (+) Transcript_46457:1017-1634(+)
MIHLGRDGAQQGVQLHWLLIQVELDRTIVELHVGDLLHDHQELVMREGHRAVSHHRVGRLVVLIIVRVQEHGMLPVVVPLARIDELGDVQLRHVHLDEVHQHLWLVLRIHRGQLCVHAHMSTLVAEPGFQQLHQRIEAALLLVLGNHLLQMVRVNNNVLACNLCTAELFRLDAGQVHLLPCLGVVRLLRRLDRLRVLSELHVAGG